MLFGVTLLPLEIVIVVASTGVVVVVGDVGDEPFPLLPQPTDNTCLVRRRSRF
jgi:hypothetical protein